MWVEVKRLWVEEKFSFSFLSCLFPTLIACRIFEIPHILTSFSSSHHLSFLLLPLRSTMFNSCRMSRPPTLTTHWRILADDESKVEVELTISAAHLECSKLESSSHCYADNKIRNELIEISFQLKFIQNNFMMSFHCDWNFFAAFLLFSLRSGASLTLPLKLSATAISPLIDFAISIWLSGNSPSAFLSLSVIRRFSQEWWCVACARCMPDDSGNILKADFFCDFFPFSFAYQLSMALDFDSICMIKVEFPLVSFSLFRCDDIGNLNCKFTFFLSFSLSVSPLLMYE